MLSAVGGRTSPSPAQDAASGASPEEVQESLITRCSSHTTAAEFSLMKVVRRVRSLRIRPNADWCNNVPAEQTPCVVEGMKSSVRAAVSILPNRRSTERGPPWDPPQHVSSWLSFWKRIRFWKVRSAVKREDKSVRERPMTSRSQMARATYNVLSENRQKHSSLSCLSMSVCTLVTETSTDECIDPSEVNSGTFDLHRQGNCPNLENCPSPDPDGYITCPSSPTWSFDAEGYLTCPSSPTWSFDAEGYLTCPSSPAVGNSDSSRRDSTSAKLSAGRSGLLINSTCANSDSQQFSAPGERSDPQRNPNSAGSDSSGSSPDRERSKSRRKTILIASSESRRFPTSRRSSESQQHLRRHSAGVADDSDIKSTSATSDTRRFSTGARFDSQRSSTCEGTELRRFSTSASESYWFEREMAPAAAAAGTSHKVLKALLAPSMSLNAFLRAVSTEDVLETQSDTRVLLSPSTNARRSSTDASVRPSLPKCYPQPISLEASVRPALSKWFPQPSESLDSSIIRTVPKIEADRDQYCNSNISWSSPLEFSPQKLDCATKEEPSQCISGHPSTSSIPLDQFPVYVGSERKKFVISSQVVTHQLFQELLVRDQFKLEASDGKISFVLRCDADFFQRFLFLVDQGKQSGM